MRRRQAAVLLLCSLAILFFLNSCTNRPTPPKMGTPEWYWIAANEQFDAGDLVKTQEHLEKVLASTNPFRERAAIWHLVMSGGMALGYKALAEAYDDGGSKAKTQAAEFRRRAGDTLRLSKQYCMSLAEELEKFRKDTAGVSEYSLEFDFPPGSASEDPAIGRIRQGILPPEEERTKAEKMTIKRGVLMETAAVVGAGEDTAKTGAMFQTKPVKVARAVFLYGIADGLVEESKVFDRKKLNEPDKKKVLLQMASDCVKPAAEGDDAELKKKAKAVQEKIAKEQKTLPKGL